LVADKLADRLERACADGVALLALTLDERAIIPSAPDDPSEGLAELRGVLWNEWEWRQRKGLGQLIFTPRRPRRLSSAKRTVARFFVFTHTRSPARYGSHSRFATTPSRQRSQTAANSASPSSKVATSCTRSFWATNSSSSARRPE